MNQQELFDWLKLTRTDGVGPVTFFGLITKFGSAKSALKAIANAKTQSGNIKYKIPNDEIIHQEIENTLKIGAKFLTPNDNEYPKNLLALVPPPPIITILGNISLLSREAIAMVGARNASAVGAKIAKEIATGLGRNDYVIVSGLARGIDTAAHIAALETGTIAVVAGGVDHIYPPENSALYHKIVEIGAIVSENPFGAKVIARDFPRRNRIISALSIGTIVVEAEEKSGSLITARYANEQGREVMAIPGSPIDPRAAGPNNLIKEGATLITSYQDVIDNLRNNFMVSSPKNNLFEDNSYSEPDVEFKTRIEKLLSPTAISLDDICIHTGLSWRYVAAAIVELELEGKAFMRYGNMVANTP